MTDLLTPAEMYRCLDSACRVAGSQSAFATQHGVSAAFVSAVLHGKKAPSPRLLAALGLCQVTRFAVVKAAKSAQKVDVEQGASVG